MTKWKQLKPTHQGGGVGGENSSQLLQDPSMNATKLYSTTQAKLAKKTEMIIITNEKKTDAFYDPSVGGGGEQVRLTIGG